MAARKAAAKPAPAAAEVRTISTNESDVPSISEGLVAAREAALAAEPAIKVAPLEEPSISPELVEAREKALEAEKKRKRF